MRKQNKVADISGDDSVRQLIERFKAGDKKAFAQIYEIFKAPAYAFAARFLAGRAEAEDVTQEAFVRVFRYINSFDEGLSFRTWLLRIVYNICMDVRRLAAREKEGVEKIASDVSISPRARAQPLEENAVDDEDQLQWYLSKLDEEDRAMLILYYLEENSYEDIAHILGIPLGTVKSRVFRAREKLRAIAKREV